MKPVDQLSTAIALLLLLIAGGVFGYLFCLIEKGWQ